MGDLPNWANSLLSAVFSLVIVGIIGLVVQHYIKKRLNRRDKEQQEKLNQEAKKQAEYEELRHQKRAAERKEELKEAITVALVPVKTKIDEVDTKLDTVTEDLNKDREATIVQMRVNMMNLHSLYKKQGWADTHQKATWNELYNNYKDLGGNHFAEYIDAYKEAIENLPTEHIKVEKKTATKKPSKKKILVE